MAVTQLKKVNKDFLRGAKIANIFVLDYSTFIVDDQGRLYGAGCY